MSALPTAEDIARTEALAARISGQNTGNNIQAAADFANGPRNYIREVLIGERPALTERGARIAEFFQAIVAGFGNPPQARETERDDQVSRPSPDSTTPTMQAPHSQPAVNDGTSADRLAAGSTADEDVAAFERDSLDRFNRLEARLNPLQRMAVGDKIDNWQSTIVADGNITDAEYGAYREFIDMAAQQDPTLRASLQAARDSGIIQGEISDEREVGAAMQIVHARVQQASAEREGRSA